MIPVSYTKRKTKLLKELFIDVGMIGGICFLLEIIKTFLLDFILYFIVATLVNKII